MTVALKERAPAPVPEAREPVQASPVDEAVMQAPPVSEPSCQASPVDEAVMQAPQSCRVVDLIGSEVLMKVDIGGRDMPFVGILLDIDENGFFYVDVSGKPTGFNHARIISICAHETVVQKPIIGPDGDIAADHQKKIDSQKVSFFKQTETVKQ